MRKQPALTRRFVLLGGAGLTIGLVAAAYWGKSAKSPAVRSHDITAWIAVMPDGATIVRVINVDMGQGAQTGLAQLVVNEMDADWSKVRVEMAPVTDTYMIAHDDFSGYYTGGSGSIRRHFDILRHAGATARAMLIEAAAKRWSVDRSQCMAENGRVIWHGHGQSLSFGELAEDAARLPIPLTVPLKPRANWSMIGKPAPRLDIAEKVNGSAVYGIDVEVDDMLIATIVQCPFFGGRIQGVDEKPALAIAGVEKVVTLESAVAVVASNFWAAKRGLDALSPRWERPLAPIASDEAMFASLRQAIGASDSYVGSVPQGADTIARVDAAFRSAHKIVVADYQLPLLSHAPMEPMNATAKVSPTSCELWAPMQQQSDMQEALASALGLAKDAVILHTTKIGGGFGRRLQTDYGVLAARVAKIAGKPVKLIWSREEDFAHDFYRPASVARVRAALDADMMIRAIESTGATSNDTAVGGMGGNYPVDLVIRQKNTKFELPIGAWRSVDASITTFLLESLIDEVAHEAGQDPLAYRRKLLAGKTRELRVLDTVAQMANWGQPPAGRSHGLAFFHSTGWKTTIAEIVELSVDGAKQIKLHRVFCAIDCGTAVNPDLVVAQTQGGIILGLSAATGEAITVKDGRVEQSNFDRYTVLRLAQTPEIHVQVLETPDADIGGVGEPPVPPAAPALANALFRATGTRVRTLPLSTSGFSLA
jgi:isoquinoline 1-oxidoreductase beta subunit